MAQKPPIRKARAKSAPRAVAAVTPPLPAKKYVRMVAEHAGDKPRFQGDTRSLANPEVKFVFDLLVEGTRIAPQLCFGYLWQEKERLPCLLVPPSDGKSGTIDWGSDGREAPDTTNLFDHDVVVGQLFTISDTTFRIVRVNVLL